MCVVATPTLSLINCTLYLLTHVHAIKRHRGVYRGKEGLSISPTSSLKIKSVAKKWPSLIHRTRMRNMTLTEGCVKFYQCQILSVSNLMVG